MSDEDQIMSTADVAAELGISENQARAYAKANGLRRIGVGFAWSPEDVDDLADQLAEADQEDDEEDESDESEHVHVQGDLEFEPADEDDEADGEDYDEEDYED